jgi:hypothetical protein
MCCTRPLNIGLNCCPELPVLIEDGVYADGRKLAHVHRCIARVHDARVDVLIVHAYTYICNPLDVLTQTLTLDTMVADVNSTARSLRVPAYTWNLYIMSTLCCIIGSCRPYRRGVGYIARLMMNVIVTHNLTSLQLHTTQHFQPR